MNGTFNIACRWMSSLHEQEEVRHTSAMLQIHLGEGVVTRNQDDWAHTVQDDVRLSAYPLALWFAQSWWRLRFESFPVRQKPSLSWKMSHEMASAGFGYVWPHMVFTSEGDQIQALSAQSPAECKEPIRYLSDLYAPIDSVEFEREIDGFIGATLARLNAMGQTDTMLHSLWRDVEEERTDNEKFLWRQLEAMLGFNPDEGPEEILGRLVSLGSRIGWTAVTELAPVCAVADPRKELERIVALGETKGIPGHVDESLRGLVLEQSGKDLAWERGWKLARSVRKMLGLTDGAVPDKTLCEILGIPVNSMNIDHRDSFHQVGLVIQSERTTEQTFFVRKDHKNRAGRRFELARFLGECISASPAEPWLVSTDAKTTCQKIQRAFAAEFLCPVSSIEQRLDSDYSDDSLDDAANYFMVSPLAIRTHLVNHRMLGMDTLRPGFNLHPWSYDFTMAG